MIPALSHPEFDQIFNLFEGLLWIAVAIGFALRVKRCPSQSNLMKIAAVAFLLFGVSDFIEIFTRAWYRPLALFFLKAACVATFLLVFSAYVRRKRSGKET